MRRLLVLGGTGEAAALAEAASDRFGLRLEIVTSLAGRTEHPSKIMGRVRIGGFGGADALGDYLRSEGFDAVIDATHPFAARISESARIACDSASVPRLVLTRDEWVIAPGDTWIEAEDARAARALVPALGSRVFLTVGSRDLASFAGLKGCWFLVRLVEPPRVPLPFDAGSHELIIARGPFDAADERRLMQAHNIEVLVTKASGGAATWPKVLAARELALPVIMLKRPGAVPGERVSSVKDALAWLERILDGLDATAAGES